MTVDRGTASRTDLFPLSWQRLAAASGIVFAVLLVAGFLISGGDTPSFDDPVQDWTKWATDNESNNRIAALITLIAAFEFLWFAGYMRSVLGAAETAARGFARVADVAFAGAIAGIVGLTMAVIGLAAGSIHAGDANPEVIRSVVDSATPGFLLAPAGFGVMLTAAGILTLRTGAFARWTGVLGLAGGVFFLLTFLTLLSKGGDNAFGVGYPFGFLSLAIWCIATSVSNVRRLAPTPVDGPGTPAV
jgi:hypothetical protein